MYNAIQHANDFPLYVNGIAESQDHLGDSEVRTNF
jgi:hypothetical protein